VTPTLKDALDRLTVEGALYEKLPDRSVRCVACGHRCRIPEGGEGLCRVRVNRAGVLRVPFGYVATSLQLDPVEKKPFFHVLPGSATLSFGMLGCNFHCPFCQNWVTSQALRDPAALAGPVRVTPELIVQRALDHKAPSITSTYNEPLVTSEWAAAIFRLAKRHGLKTAFVSNGHATPEALDYLRPWLDLCKVDLKGFDGARYRRLGGELQTVLDTISRLVRQRVWVEVVTLLVPGWNDGDPELRDIAQFLAGLSRDIPWHVTAFHPDYRVTDRPRTPAESLRRAAGIGEEAGLRFVYAGNLPGQAGSLEHTRCPACRTLLVERTGFRVTASRVTPEGACPRCAAQIPGVWA